MGAGPLNPGTLKQRCAFHIRPCADYGDKLMAMPRDTVIEIRDALVTTPGAATTC
ncbi:MAG: hypothetical protein RIG84_19610 [Roseovarius sp.]